MTGPDPTRDPTGDAVGAAPTNALERLLVVQEHDTAADQLRHRLAALPERRQLESAIARLGAIDAEEGVVLERREVIGRDLKRLEDEVSAVEARRAQTDAKLYGGAVSAARELQALQDELKALKRRQTTLEDDELELMEQAEPLDADLTRLAGQRAECDEEATRLTAALAEAEVAIAAQLETLEAERVDTAAGIDAGLLAEYERLRTQLGGVAVARLVAKTCGGCHLGLSAVEVDRIRKTPAGQMVHCEECGRILVH